MKPILPVVLLDGYKTDHRSQYPDGTELVYSNMTPRGSRLPGFDRVIFFGLQYFIREYMIRQFQEHFFDQRKSDVVYSFQRRMNGYLGPDAVSADHIGDLHDLGYLPICIKSIPEGTAVPLRSPMLTIHNTKPEFFWLTNQLETIMSNILWMPCTSATIADRYRQVFEQYADETGANKELIQFQGHDFSFRGLAGLEAACLSGAAHLLSFTGTDTVPAIDFLENYYYANSDEELVGCSVPACYSSDTEVLTENGFKLFADLDDGEQVAQYHPDGSIDFVRPEAFYADEYSGDMIRFQQKNTADLLVTPNHKMVSWSRSTQEISLKDASDATYHTANKIMVSGSGTGKKHLTAFEKLLIAFQADGSYSVRAEQYNGARKTATPIRFSLKKDRKANRLKEILSELGYEYSHAKHQNGYHSFRVLVPGFIPPSKTFDWVNLTNKSANWAEEFIEELCHWDGRWSRGRDGDTAIYSNSDRFAVEQVQSVAAICQRKSTFSEYRDPRGDRKPQFSVILSKKDSVWGGSVSKSTEEYSGTVYCVSVPSKMLIVRRNGCVSVCGNTEHSVMSMGDISNERETFRRLIQDIYPAGIVSIVSDTWDFWNAVTEIVPSLKSEILARDGKVVIRPDCYDDQTDVLTDCGWKRFADLLPNDKVAQVMDDGHYEFVVPDKIVDQEYRGDMVRFRDHHGKVDLLVTPNHRMIIEQTDSNGAVKERVVEASELGSHGHHKQSMRRSAMAPSGCRRMAPLEALKIAFQADGSFVTGSGPDRIRFSFSKQRKRDRLRSIIETVPNAELKEYTLKDGRTEWHIHVPGETFSKGFDWVPSFGSLTCEWCRDFVEEVSHWDSSWRDNNRFKFDTTDPDAASVVFDVCIAAGYGVLRSVNTDERKDIFSDVHTLYVMLDNKIGGQSWTKDTFHYVGRVYCVKVPSGRIVVRRGRCTMVCGNSGDPVKIICGDPDAREERVRKGAIECLWDTFGGTINNAGCRELDPHIGLIYGDSITLDRQEAILSGLRDKGLASSNIVLGIGSFTYQYNTRDTFGFAVKATYGEVNGEPREIFKDPKTDDGTKKSARGLLRLNGDLTLTDQVAWDDEGGVMETVFRDGRIVRTHSLSEIRNRLSQGITSRV